MLQLQSELPVKLKIIKDDEGNRQVKELTSSEEIEQAVELLSRSGGERPYLCNG